MNRRTFIAGGLGGLALLVGGIYFTKGSWYRQTVNSVRNLTGDLDAQFLRQLITADAAHSRTIMWQAEDVLTNPAIEYRVKGQTEAQMVAAQEDFFTDDGVKNNQYLAKLQELQADTDYEYRVVTDAAASDWHTLHTAGQGDFECLIFPDSQSSDYSDWKAVAQNAAERNPQAAFFINMGDIVDNGEDHTQWQAWFHGVNGIIDRIPFVPMMGNHETYDQKWKVRLPEAYLHYFVVPENNSRDFSRYYYSFDYGDVHFMVLNSQWDETEDFKPGLMAEQLNWLREDASRSRKKWKIVLVHKDVLQYRIHKRPERQEGISEVGKNFMPLFDELGIDIVFSAHLHTYRNRGHIKNFKRDSQGPLYILTGVAGNVRYPGLWIDHKLDEVVAPQPETDNYLTMQVTDKEITVKCFLPDGQEIDRVTVRKSAAS
ncbi:purple acid phosphatase family protein [Selenomonas ruminantium]|uniref:Purple acid Phosphatase, N-terminal domain n=1 Tax=Selenomonas ruminantium TaxID=971 RepID=A0A1I0VN18_SELRU|nr:metallophosphoesterase family protein [Selenomonas ruminantium]SFA77814.1 Purple acid Phosphatase, N-terminal domain [Selenomonas ruminantium]